MSSDMSLGEFLRNQRKNKGITLEQVASATKVGIRTLNALELDQYLELPAKPFVRGFVASYCRFIGLEGKEVLIRFSQFIDLKTQERPNLNGMQNSYVFQRKNEQQSRTFLVVAILSFIVFGSITLFLLKPTFRNRHGSHVDRLRAAHQDVLISPPTPVPLSNSNIGIIPLSSPSPFTTPSVDPLDSGVSLSMSEIRYKLILKMQADTWVRYQVDDRPIHKFLVRQGKSLVLRAKNKFLLQVSNLKSIQLNYNGKQNSPVDIREKFVLKKGGLTFSLPDNHLKNFEAPFGDVENLPQTADPTNEFVDLSESPGSSPKNNNSNSEHY